MKSSPQMAAVGMWDVLVVDADPSVGVLVKSIAEQTASRVRTAASVDQAQAEMEGVFAQVTRATSS